MKHVAMVARAGCLILGCLVALMGCVFQRVHYKSLQDLREESANNYSQQVLETIVGVCDEAKLPVFFSVENGFSQWTPSLSGSVMGMLSTLAVAGRGISAILLGTESLDNQVQYNDYGSAAMSRITSLYGFLCFPVRYGKTVLPNGTLYSTVEKADSRDDFLLWAKRRNGTYLGVTPAKSEQFLRFAHDVTYWSQHATPNLEDLLSTTGQLFRFSAAYNTAVGNIGSARLMRFKTAEELAKAQDALKAKQQAFNALRQEAKTSTVNPAVLQALLQIDSEELKAQEQAVAKLRGNLDKLDSEIYNFTGTTDELTSLLADILHELKKDDPDLATMDIDALIADLRHNLQTIMTADRQQLEALKLPALPHLAGLTAQDTVNKLYRQRFESLPPTFEPQRQRTE